MQKLDIPLIPMGEENSGEFLIFLPGLQSDELIEVAYDINQEEEILYISCVYGKNEDGEPVGDVYPIEINDENRKQVHDIDTLAVLHPDDQEIDSLTDDPEDQEKLEELYSMIRELEDHLQ